jgi:heme o synthase
MATTLGVPTVTGASLRLKLASYYALTKAEVNLLILMATSAGYYLGARRPVPIVGLINTLIGTLLVASGTAALNQWMERGWDAQMRRTVSRPLPSQRISSRGALVFGVALSITGSLYLLFAVNGLAALLAISTLLSYLLVYTPLKRKTPLCTLLGAFPGAMPTLIGWAGASAQIPRQAWVLFAILFLWQFPHFLAIALMYRDDYFRAGYRMLPEFDREARFTRAEILAITVILVMVTMLPVASHGSWLGWLGMIGSGIYLLYHAGRLVQSNSTAMASRLLHASVLYLPVVLGIMVAAKS